MPGIESRGTRGRGNMASISSEDQLHILSQVLLLSVQAKAYFALLEVLCHNYTGTITLGFCSAGIKSPQRLCVIIHPGCAAPGCHLLLLLLQEGSQGLLCAVGGVVPQPHRHHHSYLLPC